MLVDRVSGMSFQDFTRTRIFEPLRMTSTSWRDDFTRIVKRRAMAYDEQKGVFSTLMPFENVYGNGGLLTTVGDLLKWNANFATPVVGDARFVEEMQRRTRFTDGREHEYALGLYVDTYRGRREVDHSGGTAGYIAHLSRYPDQGVSIAVMCNVRTGNATNAAKAIADLLMPSGGVAGSDISGLLDTGEGPRFAGLYRSLKPAGALTISEQKGILVSTTAGRLTRRSPLRFEAGGDLVYEFDGRGGLRVTDEFGMSDAYERVTPWKPGLQDLKPIVGRYLSEELEVTVNVTLDGDRLVIRRPGVTLVLLPVFPDGFQSGAGWVIVRRDAVRTGQRPERESGARLGPAVRATARLACGRLVHRFIGEAVGLLVEFPTDVLERHAADLANETARVLVQRLQSGILDAVLTLHLIHEQQRVRSDVQRGDAVCHRPPQRRQQTAVLGNVVRRQRQRLFQFDDGAVLALDAHAVTGWSRVAARAAVDIG